MHHLNIEELAKKAALQDDVQLQPHQQRIIDRMSAGDKRLLLYHGLGSGKTCTSLLIGEAFANIRNRETLYVVPAALEQQYIDEIIGEINAVHTQIPNPAP